MCLIPARVIRELGLALPVFIKWDDAEYGGRAREPGSPAVSMPGVGAWQAPWTDKTDAQDWQSYYHLRNRIVSALLHSQQPHGGSLVSELLERQLQNLLSMQYSTAALKLMAIEDVLTGPAHLHREIGTKLTQLGEFRARFTDALDAADIESFPPARRRPPEALKDSTTPTNKFNLLHQAPGRVAVRSAATGTAAARPAPPGPDPERTAGWRARGARYLPIAVPAVTMAVLAAWGLPRQNAMGNDEIVTLYAAKLNLGQLARLVFLHTDIFHALYYLFMHFWVVLGTSPTVIRIPSLIAAVTVLLARPARGAMADWAVAGAAGAVLVLPIVIISIRQRAAANWITRPHLHDLGILFHDFFGATNLVSVFLLACAVVAVLPAGRPAWWSRGGLSLSSGAAPLLGIPAGPVFLESLVSKPLYGDP